MAPAGEKLESQRALRTAAEAPEKINGSEVKI